VEEPTLKVSANAFAATSRTSSDVVIVFARDMVARPDGWATYAAWQATTLPSAVCSLGHLLNPPSNVWPCLRATGNGARLENTAMKRIREVDEAVASIRRLLTSGGSQLVHGDRLRRKVQVLEEAGKGGNARRLIRAVAEISQIVCEEYLKKK
jgi:hypothetical protein